VQRVDGMFSSRTASRKAAAWREVYVMTVGEDDGGTRMDFAVYSAGIRRFMRTPAMRGVRLQRAAKGNVHS